MCVDVNVCTVRQRGLHLLSGWTFYMSKQLRHPFTVFYRLSIASLFAYVSLTKCLHKYCVFTGTSGLYNRDNNTEINTHTDAKVSPSL